MRLAAVTDDDDRRAWVLLVAQIMTQLTTDQLDAAVAALRELPTPDGRRAAELGAEILRRQAG